MRIFALSDIHVDYPDNMSWIENLSSTAYRNDTLILAGDVTHILARLERVLEGLSRRFLRVFFVPGNHELWAMADDEGDSLEKFHEILELCTGLGVYTTPQVLQDRVKIVPLFSWYTKPEEGRDSLYLPKQGEDSSLKVWSDNMFIKWPTHLAFNMTRHFLDMNRPHLMSSGDIPVISFSHFLPRQDLIFSTEQEDKPQGGRVKDSYKPFNFSRVAGTSLLDDQIRELGARVHVYGHQHRNRYRMVDGIRYVSHCLGYGRERALGAIRYVRDEPRLIWDTVLNGEPEIG